MRVHNGDDPTSRRIQPGQTEYNPFNVANHPGGTKVVPAAASKTLAQRIFDAMTKEEQDDAGAGRIDVLLRARNEPHRAD